MRQQSNVLSTLMALEFTAHRRWRLALLTLLAIWLGGLVFYAVLVIPTGAEVIGSHRAFGFITRQVTEKINWLGTGTLLVLALDTWAGRLPHRQRALRITWVVMALSQIALFALHPWLDSLLDANTATILDPEAFYLRHQIYLWTTMIQWFAGATQFALIAMRPSAARPLLANSANARGRAAR